MSMDMDCQMGGPVRTCERGPYANHFDAFTKAPSIHKLDPCVICLEPIEEGADLTSLLGCEDRHHFHANCINSWLERNATCPTCRKGATRFPFLRRMSESPQDPAVQYKGLVAIVKTASVEGPPQYSIQNVTRLGELGACRLVATAMRTFIGDRCIQLLGLEAIEALAAKSEGARAHFEQEAAETLFERIFELYPLDKDLHAAACQALVGLATGHPDWQTRLGCAGLCKCVAEILRRWPDDYGIQLSGLYALNALLSRHEANAQRVFDAGAGALLVHMMKAFWRDLDVLDGAVTAVYSLSARGPKERGALGQVDAGRVLLAVMAAHPDARDIQVKCCFTLAKLAWQHPENRQRLVALKAALVVTQALKKHPVDVPVQVAGAAAMVALYMPLAVGHDLSESRNGNGTTILLNKTAVLLTSPSQVQLKGSHLSATTPADVPTTSSPSTSMQPPHANGTALAAREIETGEAAAGRGKGSFVEGNGYPEAQAFQNLAEEGTAAQRANLLTPPVLSLVAMALAFHPHDEDISNAALGLVVSLAAQDINSSPPCTTSIHNKNNNNNNNSTTSTTTNTNNIPDINGNGTPPSSHSSPSGPAYVHAVLRLLTAVWKHIHLSPSPSSLSLSAAATVQQQQQQQQEKKEIERVGALGVLRWLTVVARDCAPNEVTLLSGDNTVHAMFEEVAGRLATTHPRPHTHPPSTLMPPPPPTSAFLVPASSKKRACPSSSPPSASSSASSSDSSSLLLAAAEAQGKRLCLDLVASLPQKGQATSWPRACGAVVEGLQEGREGGALALGALAAVVALAEGNKQNKNVLQGLGAAKGLGVVAAKMGGKEGGREGEVVAKAFEALR
ncbi:ring finger [Nannochloropsis oceanica]